jgi:hypothetical protein
MSGEQPYGNIKVDDNTNTQAGEKTGSSFRKNTMATNQSEKSNKD